MRSDVNDRNEICDQIDDLITSVDAMRWRPESAAADDTEGVVSSESADWVPPECKERFDALYETIDAFAGAINDRMRAWEARVQGSLTPTAERDTVTSASSEQR